MMFIEKFCFHLYRCPDEDFNEILKPKLAANIEKARIAMSRLEEIFTQNPSLQTTSVMRQLLDVYKDCRLVALEGEFVRYRTNLGEQHKWERSEVLTKFWSENLTL